MNLQFNLNRVSVSVETYTPRIQLELENIMLKQMIKQHAPSLEGYAAVSMESGIWETIKNFFKRIIDWLTGKGKEDDEKAKENIDKARESSLSIKANVDKVKSEGVNLSNVKVQIVDTSKLDSLSNEIDESLKVMRARDKIGYEKVGKYLELTAEKKFLMSTDYNPTVLYLMGAHRKALGALKSWDVNAHVTRLQTITTALNDALIWSKPLKTENLFSVGEQVLIPIEIDGNGLKVEVSSDGTGKIKADFKEEKMKYQDITGSYALGDQIKDLNEMVELTGEYRRLMEEVKGKITNVTKQMGEEKNKDLDNLELIKNFSYASVAFNIFTKISLYIGRLAAELRVTFKDIENRVKGISTLTEVKNDISKIVKDAEK